MRTVMKNKVFTRLIAVFIMALAVLTAAYPQATYAKTDEKEAAQEELKEEIKKPEITAIEKEKEKEVRYPNKLNAKEPENLKQNASASGSEKTNTNKGVASAVSKSRASVVENKDNANKDYPIHHNSDKECKEADKYSADARQFITFKTKNGKTFHLIINHDEQGENVMLLTEVSEDDLLNMVEVKEKPKEAIFRLVYHQAHSQKKMKRLWISSMEDSAIKAGFDNLKDGKDYDNLFESAQARAIADWLVGMNISRLYSCLYKQNYSVGRVQTPTLSMIADRDNEIANFKKEKYYTVELSTNGFVLSTDRMDDKTVAEQLINSVGATIEITDVISKEKITKPDLPFDLTTLQRECNKYFGYSAKQTLDYAQSLYEKKLITYPRTDSRCLTEDMITSTVNNILGKNDFDIERIKTVFNSSKVTDHHAIIPTISSLQVDLSKLPESEAKVYRLISNKLNASVGYPLIENTTKIVAEYESQDNVFEFTATGKVITDEGFTKYLKEYKSKKNEDTVLPSVSIGDILEIENKEIKEKYTTPPKHFTEVIFYEV